MKLLCVGNSFSEDACAYMAKIAKAGNFELTTYNLYIGGCSLERHFSNMGRSDEEHLYTMQTDGGVTARKISLEDALKLDTYDVISVQQASPCSGMWETYVPYLSELVKYVRKFQPQAKLALHQTWAYEYNSSKAGFANYGHSQARMHEQLTECYKKAAELICADIFIPSGELIARLREKEEFDPERGGIQLTRDGFHLSLDYGRYAVGALWCTVLGMKGLDTNPLRPSCDTVDERLITLIKDTIKNLLA